MVPPQSRRLSTARPGRPAPQTFTTESEARGIPPPTDTDHVEVWHATQVSFGVRVQRRRKRDGIARRVWIARFRNGQAYTKRNIGEVGKVDIADAMYRARRLRNRGVARGVDAVVPNLQEAYAEFLESRDARLSEETLRGYARAMERVKRYWSRPIDMFSVQDMRRIYREVKKAAGETQARRSGEERPDHGTASAQQTARVLHAIFAYEVRQQIVESNPVAALRDDSALFAKGERKAPALTRAELPVFWNWLNSRLVHDAARDYICTALFTCMRRGVLGSLEWRNYDDVAGTYLLMPDQRGNKARKLIPLPLPGYVIDGVFRKRYKDAERDKRWIIPSMRHPGQPTRSVRGMFDSLRERHGIKCSDHVLRRTSATICYRATGDRLITQRLLTHNLEAAVERESTAAGYMKSERDQLRDAMEAMVAYVQAAGPADGAGTEPEPALPREIEAALDVPDWEILD